MPIYVMLSHLAPDAMKAPEELKKLERAVSERVRNELREVKWRSSFAILGPCDYLDIFEAPDEASAARVAMIVRSFGHARTEIWTALPWERFEQIIPA